MSLSIGAVSAETGLTADTLRYYERIGLLPRVSRNAGGQRRYSDSDLGRLRFIRRAQSMDFSLEEIGGLLQLREQPGDIRSEVRSMTEHKLRAIESRIRELVQLRDELTGLVEQCRASEGCCPIIEHMAGETK
jgi:DNA-binding transcriptional MerR regulator